MKLETKKTISARVNESITEILNQQELPLSQIVEAGIIHFLKLKEEDKIAFIAENCAEVTTEEDLVLSPIPWSEFLKENIGTTKFKYLIEIAILARAAGVGFHKVKEGLKASGMLGVTTTSVGFGIGAGAGAVAGSIMSLANILTKNNKRSDLK